MSVKKNKLLESAQKNIQKGQFGRAIDEYEEIIKLDPGDIRHRQKLAELMAKANRKDDAVREYSVLAKHYVDSVHYVKAIAVYKQIQKLEPTKPETSLTLASLNEKQGLIGNAIAEYNGALRIYESNGENRKSLSVLESLQALDPQNSAIRLRIAEKCFKIGDEQKALEVFENLARSLKDNEDESGFERVSERMLALFPEQAAKIMEDLVGTNEPEPFHVEPAVTSPAVAPIQTPLAPSPVTVVNQNAIQPPVTPVSPSLNAEQPQDKNLIKIEGLQEDVDLPPLDHEWEEEIDLDLLAGQLASKPVVDTESGHPTHFEKPPEPIRGEVELDLDIEPDLELGAELEPEVELELEPEAELELELEPEVELELEPEAELELEPEAELELELEPEVELELEPEVELELEPEVELELEPEAELEPEVELELEPEVKAETEPEVEAETEPEVEAETEPEVEAEAIALLLTEDQGSSLQQPSADMFDLAGELSLFADELDFDLPQKDTGGAPFTADTAEMFKTSDLEREDAESHYSLGLAYKEMGLYDEAINEFLVASNSPARKIDCLLLQGLCHRDNGNLSRAEAILSYLMEDPSISEDELLSVKYELANCYELSGDMDIARRLLAEIVTIRPHFSDAASRLANL